MTRIEWAAGDPVPQEVPDGAVIYRNPQRGVEYVLKMMPQWFPGPTDEQRAEWAAEREAYAAWFATFVERVAAIDEPLARAVLDLHQMGVNGWESGDCLGCDVSGYEGEQPRWPCRTVDLVAEGFGIETEMPR